jgi:integrase/recombinase XerC
MTIRACGHLGYSIRTVCLLSVRAMTDAVTGDTGTVADYRRYMRAARRAATTVQTRMLVLRMLERHAGRPVDDLTGDELYAWQCSLGELAAATVQTYTSHVRSFYGWLVERGLRDDDPSRLLVRVSVPQGEPTPIPERDLARALAELPQVVRLWLMLAAFCGLRAAEIAALRRESVQEREDPPMLVVHGKGGKIRRVKLVPSVAAELAAFGMPVSGRLFRRSDGRPETGRHVSAVCCRWLRRIGVGYKLHSGRHRYATQMLGSGANLRIVQEALGHKSPATTAIYTRVLPRDAAPFADAIDHPLTGDDR